MRAIAGQRVWIATAVTICAVAITLYAPPASRADTCAAAPVGAALPGPGPDMAPCADVLSLEARWLAAITAGDRDTIVSILNPNFKHITSNGRLVDHDQEVAETAKLPITMTPSDQLVDVAGNLAVIHGVNTITQSGKVQGRERFTDVFVNQNGWTALSAQETEM